MANAIPALLALPIAALLGYHAYSEHDYEQAVAAGEPVLAQVKRLDDGDCVIGQKGYKCLRLTLQMHPVGKESYTATCTRDIEPQWMSRVQPGSWLTVSVERTDPQRVYFDARSMAVESPQPPASAR